MLLSTRRIRYIGWRTRRDGESRNSRRREDSNRHTHIQLFSGAVTRVNARYECMTMSLLFDLTARVGANKQKKSVFENSIPRTFNCGIMSCIFFSLSLSISLSLSPCLKKPSQSPFFSCIHETLLFCSTSRISYPFVSSNFTQKILLASQLVFTR